MKMSARLLALTITALFIGSTMTALVSPIELEPQQNRLRMSPWFLVQQPLQVIQSLPNTTVQIGAHLARTVALLPCML